VSYTTFRFWSSTAYGCAALYCGIQWLTGAGWRMALGALLFGLVGWMVRCGYFPPEDPG